MYPNGLVSAIRTLTIFPVRGHEPKKRYQALLWFVVVGLGIGFLQYFAAKGLMRLPAPLVVFAGLFLAAINYVFTGGLHIDGLADAADAFGTVHAREKTLYILKDPYIGSFGASMLILVILWRIKAYQQLFNLNQADWIVYALGISRCLQGLMLLWFPYARGSEGKAYGYKGPLWVGGVLLAQIIGIELFVWHANGPFPAIISILVGLAILIPLFTISIKRISGITGDCVGAAAELFECSFLVGAIACL